MSLKFHYNQVVGRTPAESRNYSFKDERSGEQKSGTSIYGTVTLLGDGGAVAVCKIKGKSLDEANAAMARIESKPGVIAVKSAQFTGGVFQLTA